MQDIHLIIQGWELYGNGARRSLRRFVQKRPRADRLILRDLIHDYAIEKGVWKTATRNAKRTREDIEVSNQFIKAFPYKTCSEIIEGKKLAGLKCFWCWAMPYFRNQQRKKWSNKTLPCFSVSSSIRWSSFRSHQDKPWKPVLNRVQWWGPSLGSSKEAGADRTRFNDTRICAWAKWNRSSMKVSARTMHAAKYCMEIARIVY